MCNLIYIYRHFPWNCLEGVDPQYVGHRGAVAAEAEGRSLANASVSVA